MALSYVWSDPRSPGKLLNSCLVATNPETVELMTRSGLTSH